MARKPGSTSITVNGLQLYAEDIQRSYVIRDFDRLEFLNSKLQQAQDNVTNARPTIVTNAVNAPVQIAMSPCGFNNSVPLGPEDTNLTSVYQRMNIIEYEVTGAPSSPSNIASLQPTADEHKRRMDEFEFYLASLSQNISYQQLLLYRAYTFSYLTATGISAVDPYDFGTLNNILIKELRNGVIHVNPASQTAVTTGWKLTLQVISITARNSY